MQASDEMSVKAGDNTATASFRFNYSQLLREFTARPCQENDVVFAWQPPPASPICWNHEVTGRLGVPMPEPTHLLRQYPPEYAVPLFGYAMPPLVLLTVIVNTLIVIVMSRLHMRTTTNLLLMAMAVSDTLTLVVPFPWMMYLYTFSHHQQPLGSATWCLAFAFMTDSLPTLFHTASVWLTLALAVQRYVYVCRSSAARTRCASCRPTLLFIAGVYATSFLHQLPRFFDRHYATLMVIRDGAPQTTCSVGQARWVASWIGVDAYYAFYFGFRALCVHLLPCVLLVVFNVLLVLTLRRAHIKRRLLLRNSTLSRVRRGEPTTRALDTSCTTFMLVVVVSVFLIVEVPLTVVTTLHIIHSLFEPLDVLNYDVSRPLVVVINFIIIVAYPINFAIYCGMSRQFRDTFTELFCRRSAVVARPSAGTRLSTATVHRRNETAL